VDHILTHILPNLPDKPGVYQFFNASGEIIYVGKAINLKKRVSSYFHKNHHDNRKLFLMVKKIQDIRYIIVNSEQDALLLENNLIKELQPRYNFLLKDDKTYPWICIKNEPFPRVFSTRNVLKDGSQYFGPYTSSTMVRTLLELIRQLFPIRTCALNLNEDSIAAGKHKICLEYHLGNCLGPCEGKYSLVDYSENIHRVKEILKGNLSVVSRYLQSLMSKMAEDFRFEEANLMKQKIEILEKFQSKSTVVNPAISNADVFSIYREDDLATVNYMRVVDGAVLMAHTVELDLKLDETNEELLASSILELRYRFESSSPEIIIPFPLEYPMEGINFTVPKIGDKKKLLELSERNAKFYLLNIKKRKEDFQKEKPSNKVLERIQKDLHLNELPEFIECFDNSNIQGTNPVAACVVFKNAKPFKSEYRHFNVKTVIGPDDFSSMEEIVFRRYSRLLDENRPLPQLIVIDGGKGQLHAAVNSLQKLGIYGKMGIIGIAKKLEEIYFPGDSLPVYLDKSSVTLKVIQQIRDEAHRFGITFHRQKRSTAMIQSGLETIPGIGEKTLEVLMKNFKSMNGLKKAEKKDIAKLVGNKKADIVEKYLNELSSGTDQVN
jgi:excinuclease ABC subunit C